MSKTREELIKEYNSLLLEARILTTTSKSVIHIRGKSPEDVLNKNLDRLKDIKKRLKEIENEINSGSES